MTEMPDASVTYTDPVVVLSASRSGSTLLRFLLDAHPDLACPPETKLPWVASVLAESLSVLHGAPVPTGGQGLWTVAEPVVVRLRQHLDLIMSSYLESRGKKRFCDKNLGSAPWVGLLLRVYPKTKILCLYRHPMDMIHSGLEACPWGLNGYGFDSYAAGSPGNMVTALGRYWADYTTGMLAAEEHFSDSCYRIRYEDLVEDPEVVASAIFGFLGAEPAPGITDRCFSMDRERSGPGDYKIWSTSRITGESVGRGWSVPVHIMPAPLVNRINGLTKRLGYRGLDDMWGSGDPPTDLRQADGSQEPEAPTVRHNSRDPGLPPAGARLLADRIQDGMWRVDEGFAGRWQPWSTGSVLLTAVMPARAGGQAWWRLDLATRAAAAGVGACEAEADWSVSGSAEAWERVLRGQINLGVAFRHDELRYRDKGDPGPGSPAAETRVAMLADLLGISRWAAPDENGSQPGPVRGGAGPFIPDTARGGRHADRRHGG